MVFALSIAGTLGREAGRLVEDVLSRCSAQRGKAQNPTRVKAGVAEVQGRWLLLSLASRQSPPN